MIVNWVTLSPNLCMGPPSSELPLVARATAIVISPFYSLYNQPLSPTRFRSL